MIKENQVYKLKGTKVLFKVKAIVDYVENASDQPQNELRMIKLLNLENGVESTVREKVLERAYELVTFEKGKQTHDVKFETALERAYELITLKKGEQTHDVKFEKEDLDFYTTAKSSNNELKIGDFVHVSRLNGDNVNFHANLDMFAKGSYFFKLINRTDGRPDGAIVHFPTHEYFGKDTFDYYELVSVKEIERLEEQEVMDMLEKDEEQDFVNKPSHYVIGDYEVKDIVSLVADKYHKGSVAHNVASALEYQMRAPDKNGLEDIKKARKCLDFAIENWDTKREGFNEDTNFDIVIEIDYTGRVTPHKNTNIKSLANYRVLQTIDEVHAYIDDEFVLVFKHGKMVE